MSKWRIPFFSSPISGYQRQETLNESVKTPAFFHSITSWYSFSFHMVYEVNFYSPPHSMRKRTTLRSDTVGQRNPALSQVHPSSRPSIKIKPSVVNTRQEWKAELSLRTYRCVILRRYLGFSTVSLVFMIICFLKKTKLCSSNCPTSGTVYRIRNKLGFYSWRIKINVLHNTPFYL